MPPKAYVVLVCFLHLLQLFLARHPAVAKAGVKNDAKAYLVWNTTAFETKYLNLPPNSPSFRPDFYAEHRPTVAKQAWTGQSNQDKFVFLNSNEKKHGFFVDLAANHWKAFSNSYSLETYKGWNGICIEANPEYFKGLLANRRCKLVASPVSNQANEEISFGLRHEYSGIVADDIDPLSREQQEKSQKITMVTVTLNQILHMLHAPHVMDYLSLDIEGAEFRALQNFDFDRYIFLMITIERPTEECHNLLAKNGYRFLKLMARFGDCAYIHHTHPNFVVLMQQYRDPAGNDIHYGWHNFPAPFLNTPAWLDDKYNPKKRQD